MITKETFKNFIKIISIYFAKRKILVGAEIYNTIIELDTDEKSGFLFIECDLLKDRVVIFGRHPLSNQAVFIDDIIALDNYISNIQSPLKVFTNASDIINDNISLIEKNGNITMLHLDYEIKKTIPCRLTFQQE